MQKKNRPKKRFYLHISKKKCIFAPESNLRGKVAKSDYNNE